MQRTVGLQEALGTLLARVQCEGEGIHHCGNTPQSPGKGVFRLIESEFESKFFILFASILH